MKISSREKKYSHINIEEFSTAQVPLEREDFKEISSMEYDSGNVDVQA